MALTYTTTSAAVGVSDVFIKVTSTSSGFPAVGVLQSKQVMRIDGEDMLIDQVVASGLVKVLQRGFHGSIAAPHDILAVIATSSNNADFLAQPWGADSPRPPYLDDIVTLGEDTVFAAAGTPAAAGVQPYPVKNTTYLITKASACAITLIATGATTPAPSAASMGVKLTFINGVAAANTVTYGPGFLGDTTSSDVATSGSKVGATFICEVGYTGLLATVNTGTGTGWTLG